jgi:hypothetical protein
LIVAKRNNGNQKPTLRKQRFLTFNDFVDNGLRALVEKREYGCITVWLYMFRKANFDTGLVKGVSARSISEATGLDKNTASNSLKKLIDISSITIVEKPTKIGERCIYRVNHIGQDAYEPAIQEAPCMGGSYNPPL